MSPAPSDLPPLPADYVAYIKPLRTDQKFAAGVMYAAPRDPGSVLGRAGDENFQRSVLIGTRHSQHIALTFENDRWTYAIVNYSERPIQAFDSLAQLLAIMR